MKNYCLLFVLTIGINSLAFGQCPAVCNCIGDKSFGGECYARYGGPAYKGFGGPAYDGYGGPCYEGYGGLVPKVMVDLRAKTMAVIRMIDLAARVLTGQTVRPMLDEEVAFTQLSTSVTSTENRVHSLGMRANSKQIPPLIITVKR